MMDHNHFTDSYQKGLTETVGQVAAALFAIDVARSQAAAEAYAQEKEQLDEALSAAHQYAAELRETIRDAKAAPDGNAAASALLRGERVENSSATHLQEELDTLLSGIRVLANQRHSLETKHRYNGDPVEPEVTAAVIPFVEFFEDRIKALTEDLAQLYADAQAVSYLARKSHISRVASDISELLTAARLGGRKSLDYFPPSAQLARLAEAPCMQHLRRRVSMDPVIPHGRYG